MTRIPFLRAKPNSRLVDNSAILNSLATSILVLDEGDVVQQVNSAAEQMFETSAALMRGVPLRSVLPDDCPLFALVLQARQGGNSVAEHGVELDSPRTGHRAVTIEVSPMPEQGNWVVVALHEQSIALKIGAQLNRRHSVRSVTAMAAMLAHEVKNPLSGIRGAAQLLEQSCSPEDRTLTHLICEEADRIVALVDRIDVFSDQHPMERDPVNIHAVLEHVRRVAHAGFARHVRFIENYDPSLPPVLGNRDQLIQAFLNLVKNAAEATPSDGAEVVLSTAYRHGVRLAVPGSDNRVQLPLTVSVQDNGQGITEDMRSHLFDPFVTTKANGSGLGLALVAKIIGDHGGVIEFESQPRRTNFRVMLPLLQHGDGPR